MIIQKRFLSLRVGEIVVLMMSWGLVFSQKISSLKPSGVKSPQNIILLIGDGMGVAHVSALVLQGGEVWKKFSHVGLMTTYSENNLIPDSAAAGTALATGRSTWNGFVSMFPTGENFPTLMEIAKRNKKVTGLVVTSTVTHATPAVFYAHESSRSQENAIALWATNGTMDVMIGGGLSYFGYRFTNEEIVSEYARSKNEAVSFVSLAEWMSYKGWKVVSNIEDLRKPFVSSRVIGLLGYGALPYVAQGRNYSLGELTSIAISLLSREKNGFVLMVEGSQIDWASHDNNTTNLFGELKDFETAVEVALEFARTNGNTLVVVTADHETGGLAIKGGSVGKFVRVDYASKDHTASMVPLFAYGPGAERLTSLLHNTEVGQYLIELIELVKK